MIYVESVFFMDHQMMDLIIIKKVKSQAILLYWIDSKEFCNKKT